MRFASHRLRFGAQHVLGLGEREQVAELGGVGEVWRVQDGRTAACMLHTNSPYAVARDIDRGGTGVRHQPKRS